MHTERSGGGAQPIASPWPTIKQNTPQNMMKPSHNRVTQFGTNYKSSKRNSGVNNSAVLSHGTWKQSQIMHLNISNERVNPIRTSYNNTWKKNQIGKNP